jgi:hypothetical protein
LGTLTRLGRNQSGFRESVQIRCNLDFKPSIYIRMQARNGRSDLSTRGTGISSIEVVHILLYIRIPECVLHISWSTRLPPRKFSLPPKIALRRAD